jgi:lipopolysaccharide transport system permease protein
LTKLRAWRIVKGLYSWLATTPTCEAQTPRLRYDNPQGPRLTSGYHGLGTGRLLVLSLNFITPAWRQRHLLWGLVRRDIAGRYRGSAAGLLWSLLTPMLLLGIYTFVFSVVFRARWGNAEGDKVAFAVNLFAGMIVHSFVAECISRAPLLILQNANYVKRVIFPLELLPWMLLGSALFHATLSLSVLFGALLLAQGHLPPTVVLLPLIWLPMLLGTLGVTWLLASLGVFLRDINQLTGTMITILLFLSPIFYPASTLEQPYRSFLYANPLTIVIEQTRQVVIAGQLPSLLPLAVTYLAGAGVAALGFAWFQRSRRAFADVL